MTRTTALTSVTLTIALAIVGSRTLADEHDPNTQAKDTSALYLMFLDSYTGKHKSPINVSERADTLSSEDIKAIAECAGGSRTWIDATTQSDVGRSLGKVTYVRLVDPDKWVPSDPGKLIAEGVPVDRAVARGFSHGLLSLSSIIFDTTRQVAALKYSFGCGELCGHGAVVMFERRSSGWVQSAKQCGGWVS